ncbi:MAG: caspase family protein [Anaerolineae bacterium]|nr:caspase family protein [Anaerolineae bacterium]
MPDTTSPSSNLHALLIGIDYYLPHRLAGGGHYPALHGCVADVRRVAAFLQERLCVPAEQIVVLTSTDAGLAEPPEPREAWPTYERMVTAIQEITARARPGDQVYLHYSGHGGRQHTAYAALKGETAYDEGLVPMDLGTARYLLDVELAYLFQAMVDRGLLLTVVLDSCHSGGAVRGMAGAAVRGITEVDTPRPAASLVAPARELAAGWEAATRGQTRAIKPGGGWLPEPEAYVLLAACRPNELAHEYEVEPGARGGALTYWMMDALKQIGPGLNYAMVHQKVLARIHTLFPDQSPQIQGDGSRAVLGSEHVRPPAAVNVLAVEAGGGRVQLATGQGQGVRPGTQFVIYPPGTLSFEPEQRQALVAIDGLGAHASWARVEQRLSGGTIEPGAQAILTDPGSMRLRRGVGLFRRDDLPPGVDQAAALAAVEAALGRHGGGWLVPAAEGRSPDYQVVVADDGLHYEIWNPAGRPVPRLEPPVAIAAAGAAQQVVERLVHLAKYQTILALDNHDDTSPLARALEIELARPQADYVPGDPLELRPVAGAGGTPLLKNGERAFLRVRNRSSRVLNVTVMALQADWSIAQLHPRFQEYDTLDGGSELRVKLQAGLPAGYTEGHDTLKVLASVGPASYKWLELPALDGQRGTRGVPRNALEAMMDALSADRPGTRTLSPVVDPSYEWTMAQMEVWVKE